jgi:RNA polymerase sigma factor (sigma-70 family)
MLVLPGLTEEKLACLPARKRAVVKLRTGSLPLSEEELQAVLPHKRKQAAAQKPRSLQEVGDLLGVSKERIRQLQERALELLGLTPLRRK